MPSRNPRINIVVDPQVYEQIKQLAERRGVSISMAARDLIRDALVMEEDADLAELAGEREETFREDAALSHEEAWGLTGQLSMYIRPRHLKPATGFCSSIEVVALRGRSPWGPRLTVTRIVRPSASPPCPGSGSVRGWFRPALGSVMGLSSRIPRLRGCARRCMIASLERDRVSETREARDAQEASTATDTGSTGVTARQGGAWPRPRGRALFRPFRVKSSGRGCWRRC